jgi:outer membrane immunogenic protein
MTKLLRAGVSFAALMIAAGAANAADLSRGPYKAPPPAYIEPIFSWSGFYVGANAGYMWGSAQFTGGAGNFETSPKGFLAGGQIGYNLQTGNIVFGLEGDIDYVDAKATANNPACVNCTVKNSWLATGRGRVGYSFGRFLPDITGGVAGGKLETTVNGGTASKTQVGWTLGAGLEYALWNSWSVKAEYLYVDLGSITCGSAACPAPADTKVDFTANIFRAGINYRF